MKPRKITFILSTYDDLIGNNRRRMALLEDAARHVYQEWFVRLRLPGKDFGLIVDYNGILKSLREALAQYALGDEGGGGEEIVAPERGNPQKWEAKPLNNPDQDRFSDSNLLRPLRKFFI